MAKQNRYKQKRGKASRHDWQQLSEDTLLRDAYTRFARAVQHAQEVADARSPLVGQPASHIIDLREAGRILDQHPHLSNYLLSVREQQLAQRQASEVPLERVKASPTGMTSQSASLGGWAGYMDQNQPQGVPNAKILRDWSENSEWVNAGINYYCERIGRADIDVLPYDERSPFNRAVEKSIKLLLDQPNEMGDTWPGMVRMLVRDLITLGRGVWSKSMTGKRVPVMLYPEDAATIKIYPNWSGDPNEARYLFDPGGMDKTKIPLRNDEILMPMYGMSSYRFSLSPVQVLRNTIIADLKATESAARIVDQKPPPHIIQIPNASTQQIQTLRSTYNSDLAGRNEVMFLGGPSPAQIKSMVYSLKDNQWMEWLEYLAQKIAVVLGLSLQTFSFTGDVNHATATSQQDIEENKGLIPLMLLLEECFNRQLLADFAPRIANGRTDINKLNLRVVYPEISEAARQMHFERSVQVATASLAGLPSATLNQMLMMRGEEPVKGGNTYWVNSANGPIPWLSYDNEYGDWTPPMTSGVVGAQDPEGGPSPDDTADEDMGKNEDSSAKDSDVPTQPASADDASSSSDPAPGESPPTAKIFNDFRRPGITWSPATVAIRKSSASRRSTLPLPDMTAREQLAKTLEKLFGDVEKRGTQELERLR